MSKKPAVGDVLYSSWGYDQTNIDFYQVVRASDKSVWLSPMSKAIVSVDSWASEYVVPGEVIQKVEDWDYVDGERVSVVREVKPSMHRIKNWYQDSYGVNLNSYASAVEWDGKPKLQSHWG